MHIPVSEAIRQLESRGLVERDPDTDPRHYPRRISDPNFKYLGCELPADLADLYQENIASIGDYTVCAPYWNAKVLRSFHDEGWADLDPVQAFPLFGDGCGNLWGLDLTPGVEVPAVYFFDHEVGFEKPEYAAGSSLGAFLLLLGDHDRAIDESWPDRWELNIDPDIDSCPRAPAIWRADEFHSDPRYPRAPDLTERPSYPFPTPTVAAPASKSPMGRMLSSFEKFMMRRWKGRR